MAVVGGGPGGLVLARVLQLHGVPVTVFERDPASGARAQGGTLDLRPDSGQAAVSAAGLDAEFRELSRPEGEEMRLLDASGRTLLRHTPGPGLPERPEIDRADLRRMLLGSLEAGTVRHGVLVHGVEDAGGGRGSRVLFARESGGGAGELTGGQPQGPYRSEEFDLVVGADGGRSRVRAQLGGVAPVFSGVHFVESRIEKAAARAPEAARTVGDGSVYAFEGGRGIMAQLNTSGTVRIYFVLRQPEHALPWPDGAGPAGIRDALRRHFSGWSPALLALLDGCEDVFHDRPLHTHGAGRTWPAHPRATLVGDAAHLMTPFAGMGANLALLDGAELGLAVAESATVPEALERYERAAVPRGARAIARSARGLAACMSSEAPGSAVAYFTSPGEDG
ncbi:FAD-dependent oxidoreductase [Streptomyces sp. NPDC050560]|uniref:FAD-dependent oxidoreductase n=1 Tax=Streptomyces sp. NPDC050560 TaxID=3365630 RepID=UPI0037AC75C3